MKLKGMYSDYHSLGIRLPPVTTTCSMQAIYFDMEGILWNTRITRKILSNSL